MVDARPVIQSLTSHVTQIRGSHIPDGSQPGFFMVQLLHEVPHMPCNCGKNHCAEYDPNLPKPMTHDPLLRAGVLVRLKSGSPELTVCEITDSKVTVAWFGGPESDSLSVASMPVECFERIK